MYIWECQETIKGLMKGAEKNLKEDKNLDNEIHAGGQEGRLMEEGRRESSGGRGMEEGSGSKGKCMPDS